MLRVQQVKLPVEHSEKELEKKLCRLLGIDQRALQSYEIVKRSVDARKKPELYYSYTVDCKVQHQERVIKRLHSRQVSEITPKPYRLPEALGTQPLAAPPVIAGCGPAGLFSAYLLAQKGYCPVIIERGDEAFTRKEAVDRFWQTGVLDPASNVQFGEGGAGTFSDGKLNTSVKDPYGRNRYVLETLVRFGAPEQILYDHKPHLGTDLLIRIVTAMREEITRLGGSVLFRHQLTDLRLKDGRLTAIQVNDNQWMPANCLVLAIGHSARDTIHMLYDRGLPMEAKAFAVGVRIEHPQTMINESQYGQPRVSCLGAAPYKTTHRCANGRSVYSFCMCPGGYVVNASSEEGRLAVNGMSYSGRNSANANSAMVVSVRPEDYEACRAYDTPPALAGIDYQRQLEERAFQAGQGLIPVQLFADFKAGQVSTAFGEVKPCIKGACRFAELNRVFPEEINDSIIEGITAAGREIKGFDRGDAILSGVESRTSSPVRILRGEDFSVGVTGIYPCGEGAGYAGGITSAAMDGLKTAEAILEKYSSLVV